MVKLGDKSRGKSVHPYLVSARLLKLRNRKAYLCRYNGYCSLKTSFLCTENNIVLKIIVIRFFLGYDDNIAKKINSLQFV